MNVVRAGEQAAAMNRAREQGYEVCRWPSERGGGFVMWSGDFWLLVGCESERWREAWGNTFNLEEEA